MDVNVNRAVRVVMRKSDCLKILLSKDGVEKLKGLSPVEIYIHFEGLDLHEEDKKKLRAVFGLRFHLESDRVGRFLRDPDDVREYLNRLAGQSQVETLWIAYLDSNKKVVDVSNVAVGTAACVPFAKEPVLRKALLLNCPSIIMMHNHPSGGLVPSDMDVTLTKRMAAACFMLGLELVDHIIVRTDGRYYSISRSMPELLKPEEDLYINGVKRYNGLAWKGV